MRFHTLAAALAAIGCVVRGYCYLLNPSLNHDDAALALNILQRSALELRHILDTSQLAPWGFLVIERSVVTIAGASEPALRLVPFLAGVASVPAFWYLAARHLQAVEIVMAVGFFSLSQDLITSAVQVKQYSVETLIAILMLIAARPLLDGSMTQRQAWQTGAAGAAAIWFSFTAVFVLAGIGLAALIGRHQSRDLPRILLLGAAWSASGVLYVITVLRHQLRGSMLFDIWRHEFPTSVATEWPMWLVNRFVTLGSVSTAVRVAAYAAVALAFAIVVTFTGRRRFSMALALIIIITLSAGAAGFYPFVGRFLFFAAPVALLLMFGEIGRWAKSRSPVVHQSMAAIASVALIYAGVSLANRSIFKGFDFDDARGAYIHIRNRMEPGDAIHGSPAAQPTLRFYASDLASRQRMSSEWPVGEARVWFVFFQPTEAGFDRESVRAARRSGDLRESVSRGLHKATMWQLSPQAESLQP